MVKEETHNHKVVSSNPGILASWHRILDEHFFLSICKNYIFCLKINEKEAE